MTPQIPGYLLEFESTIRPLIAAIALGLDLDGLSRARKRPRGRVTRPRLCCRRFS